MRPRTDRERRQKVEAIKRSAHRPAALEPTRCAIPGCTSPTQASAGRGLSKTHCRIHVQHRNRHGSYWKGTYTAAHLTPYREAAEARLRTVVAEPEVAGAVYFIGVLLRTGRRSDPGEWRSLPPADKAKAALVRLYDAGVPPLRILSRHMAVSAAILEDPLAPGGDPDEYRTVQIAKAVFRLASGHHRDYGPWGKLHVYPRSSGLVLRHLGRLIDEACRTATEMHLDAVLASQHEANRRAVLRKAVARSSGEAARCP